MDDGAGGGDGAGDDGVAGEEGIVNIASSCVVSKGVALKSSVDSCGCSVGTLASVNCVDNDIRDGGCFRASSDGIHEGWRGGPPKRGERRKGVSLSSNRSSASQRLLLAFRVRFAGGKKG